LTPPGGWTGRLMLSGGLCGVKAGRPAGGMRAARPRVRLTEDASCGKLV